MRLLAFSDLHRDRNAAQAIVDASKDADVVIGAGDFANKREGARDTLCILKASLAPVLLVHGNHDDPLELCAICDDWTNGHYLHGTSIEIGGQRFFGLGGEVPSRNDVDWNVTETEADAAKMLASCPPSAILITHTPPHGTADLQTNGANEGSNAIRDAAIRCQPEYLLCGHIHAAWGTSGRIGTTRVHNLGPTLNWFTV